ncbi:MAG: response regulator [Actinomycetota bacterium]
MADLILVADDDPDILRFVEMNLRLEGFDVATVADGKQALDKVRTLKPALLILDVMMPEVDGFEVCQRLRRDSRTSHVSVIMLTARAMSADKILGLTAGADDYISKPFDPLELVARVKTTLRRTREMRAVSPLTGLPGNVQIDAEMRQRLAAGETFGVLWLDLDNFKSFNDCYGFTRGDRAINYLAATLREVAEDHPSAFVGHIGGDDFVVICDALAAAGISESLVERFDGGVASLYDAEDAERGHIVLSDRLGRQVEFPLLTVSIGGATNEHGLVDDYRELVEVATEMKAYVKKQTGSVWIIDRRGRGDSQSSGPRL